jgi:4-amino-4-deoxy-L-arabinose transferase-like glycosyltransferase
VIADFQAMSRRCLALVAAISLVARVGYVVAFMRGYEPTSDADSYFEIGRAVSKGQGYAFTLPFEFVHATAIRPPLYPTVLAGAFRVFGAHVGIAQGVNVVAGCGVAVLGALIAQRVGGLRAGFFAGIVLALYPPLIANDVTVLVESIAVLLLFATVLLLLDGRTVLAGISLGLLMLDRASAQWFLVVIAAWVLWRFGWRHAARLVVIALLVVSPWVVRNAVQVGGPVIVATNGFNLNSAYSNEARQSKFFVDAYIDPRFAVMRLDAADEIDLDTRLRTKALRDLRAHPTQFFRIARLNAEHWFELRPGLNREPERLDGRNLAVRDWTLPLFYLVTVAGLFALVRARRAAAAQLLALAVAYFTVVSLVSIAVPRLRSVFDGCVAIGAGVALAWAIDRSTKINDRPPYARPLRALRSAIILGLIAVLVATTALLWQADTHRRARRAVETAVRRDAPAIDALATQFRAYRSASEPPRLLPPDLERVHDLVTVLGQRVPQVTTHLRPYVADALRSIRVASHEADVISLLSIGEYFDAAAKHRSASLDAVRTRYEGEVRSGDATLEPWDTVMSAASLRRARATLNKLSGG